ncbi:uncharacterized protein ACLA_052600 [Aspergillus clavatus NRRL 1]|uniref:Terpene synthase n=1 Tax=Aspergillus clavatus (strain ATCC 1007 / CBS 513.65 / DSM 816 / NCTC 3887 / NRRL 1 / QM 1276 / 107) TaxID=344612 RepID=A1CIT2_ASPCL|nr:uncharacterized protein ACLA_052600 [Aspergillus clavatus NRRL 1]EAW10787.1 conserved hypothetical protein [Aspergillus clavatus NRRL 1]
MSAIPQTNASAFVRPRGSLQGSDELPPSWNDPRVAWKPLIHPRADQICREHDDYFLQHWPFPDDKSRQAFVQAEFARFPCLALPLGHDDRLPPRVQVDVLEEMSLSDGEAYNARLMPIMRGDVRPNRTKPVEYILYDLWEDMRRKNRTQADEMLEATFCLMRAQTNKVRLSITQLDEYLKYRAQDVGIAMLCGLTGFAMDVELTAEEQDAMIPLERNFGRQISVVNDLWSWEKEFRASQAGHKEGAAISSAVNVLSMEAGLGFTAARRVLQAMVLEWDMAHNELVAEQLARPGGCRPAVQLYMKGLEYHMSGNEVWSRTTRRYVDSVDTDCTVHVAEGQVVSS